MTAIKSELMELKYKPSIEGWLSVALLLFILWGQACLAAGFIILAIAPDRPAAPIVLQAPATVIEIDLHPGDQPGINGWALNMNGRVSRSFPYPYSMNGWLVDINKGLIVPCTPMDMNGLPAEGGE